MVRSKRTKELSYADADGHVMSSLQNGGNKLRSTYRTRSAAEVPQHLSHGPANVVFYGVLYTIRPDQGSCYNSRIPQRNFP